MKNIITLLSILAMSLLTCLPAHAKHQGHGVRGELTKVDVEANSISFIKTKKPDKPLVTVTLTDETTIEINGEKATLADLETKMGLMVYVDVNEKDKTAYSIVIREKNKKKKPAKPQKVETPEGDDNADQTE